MTFDKPAYNPGDEAHVTIVVSSLTNATIQHAVYSIVSSINGDTSNLVAFECQGNV